MSIRNYSSGIAPQRSIDKICDLLRRNGANRVAIDYVDSAPIAIVFVLPVHGLAMQFRIEPNVEGALAAMKAQRGVEAKYRKPEQAARMAWKNELDWLDVQLAKAAAGQAPIEQLLLGYVVTDDGRMIYEVLSEPRARTLLLSNQEAS